MHLALCTLSMHFGEYAYVTYMKFTFSIPWLDVPRGPRLSHCRGFTITLGMTPLDEWSARHRDLYQTTHNTQTNVHPPGGFEPTILTGVRPQIHPLNRAASGIDLQYTLFILSIFNTIIPLRPLYALKTNKTLSIITWNEIIICYVTFGLLVRTCKAYRYRLTLNHHLIVHRFPVQNYCFK
jgi:hypothetical protein